jgi:hypothetical protein
MQMLFPTQQFCYIVIPLVRIAVQIYLISIPINRLTLGICTPTHKLQQVLLYLINICSNACFVLFTATEQFSHFVSIIIPLVHSGPIRTLLSLVGSIWVDPETTSFSQSLFFFLDIFVGTVSVSSSSSVSNTSSLSSVAYWPILV